MSLGAGFSVALGGMKVAQSQLDIVSNNIANADTAGYTAKSAASNSLVLAGVGSGVSLGDKTREVSESLLKSYLISNSLTGSLTTQSEYLERTQLLLGTPESANSISTNISTLQSAFDTLAADVTSSATRATLVNEAESITSRFNYLTQEMQKLRGDADLAISSTIESINSTLNTIDELNEEIVKYTVLGYDGTADLLDQRDTALRELSSQIDISYFTRSNGEIVIQTGSGITLLDKDPHYISHQATPQTSPSASYASGAIDGIYVDGVDITHTIRDGELAGLIDVRDNTIPTLQSQLDELAGVLKAEVNAAHNQGTAFPAGAYELSGTRTFIDPANQTIAISNADVRISIFDSNGKQVDTTTLIGDLGFATGSINDMATTIQDYLVNEAGLPQAQVFVDEFGKLQVQTGDSNYSISFQDVASSTPGAEQKDANITFGVGNGTSREFDGFSSFFGLNDFFVTPDSNESIFDSSVINKTANLGIAPSNPVQLNVYDTNGVMASISVTANDTLQDIVNKINELDTNLVASLVPNGSGYVFRIEDTTGAQIELTDGGSGLLTRLGMSPSNVTVAGDIQVREDIVINSNKIAVGQPIFNSSTGEYELNPADNSVANAMAKVFSETQSFEQSGSVAQSQTTLSKYSSTFVGSIATQTSNINSELAYQSELTESISLKESQISGVDIDEELANLIIYQQSYAACAQAFTATQEIIDTLLGMMR